MFIIIKGYPGVSTILTRLSMHAMIPNSVFPTQLPSWHSYMGPRGAEPVDRRRPNIDIFHTSCENQFEKLIFEPCSKIEASNLKDLPNTIILAGLDECVDHPSQGRLLGTIHKITTTHCIP